MRAQPISTYFPDGLRRKRRRRSLVGDVFGAQSHEVTNPSIRHDPDRTLRQLCFCLLAFRYATERVEEFPEEAVEEFVVRA